MPARLTRRIHSFETIREFRLAAHNRLRESVVLAVNDERLGAVYLAGYAAEMIVKLAYFRLLGFSSHQPITMQELRLANATARQLGIPFRNLHDVTGWASLLVQTRQRTQGARFSSPYVAQHLQRLTHELGIIWQESLRYKANRPYPFEVQRCIGHAKWLVANETLL